MNKILSTALEAMETMAVKVVSWITLSITSKQTVVSILKLAILTKQKMGNANSTNLMLALHAPVFVMFLCGVRNLGYSNRVKKSSGV